MNRSILFFCLLLLLPGWAAGQAYEPMVVEGAHWRLGWKANDVSNPIITPYDSIHEYIARGDTLIGGWMYKKVYHRWLDMVIPGSYAAPYRPATPDKLSVVLREDTAERKVYIRYMDTTLCLDCSDTLEYLLVDFSLALGDTFTNWRYDYSCMDSALTGSAIVDIVVDISNTMISGRLFRVLISSLDVGMVEGIGILNSLFEPILISECRINAPGDFLDWYCVGSDADCEIITSVDEMHASGIRVDISPQPASSQLQIRVEAPPAYRPTQIRLLNQQGQVVLAQPVNEVEFSLPIAHLLAGLYFLEVRSGDRSLGYQKTMIVQ
jgi:hypothetical protein